ncbi:MAG: ribulose-phosphate 3-epimerase [Clostridia bacterium]|nr:ribulose-phosphate 3-epimerase [Clostridia bacterium]
MKIRYSPTMMCADVIDLGDTLKTLESEGTDYLHIDVMDGEFVPNYAFGTDYCRKVRAACNIPLDIHLMVNKPEDKIGFFDIHPGDIVSVHVESTVHLQRLLVAIRTMGARPFVALNPATPVGVLENVLNDIDGVLVMTVNPGFSGQKLIPVCIDKVRQVREMLDKAGRGDVEIEVDGNVGFENSVVLRDAGANIFVGGSSSTFSKNASLRENIKKLKLAVEG